MSTFNTPGRRSAIARLGVFVAASLLAFASGCGGGAPEARGVSDTAGPRERPYRVVATTAMVADIVRRVGGEHARVEHLMSEGVDPHLYKPTRADLVAIDGAEVIFYNGLMLEGKMTDVLVKAARSGKPVHAVTEMLDDAAYVLTDEQDHFDPHVWMDVRGWIAATGATADALAAFDPAHASDYEANASAYTAELEALDAYAKRAIASIPPSRRVLVTAHDAFGYMGRAYGLEVMGIQGISTESEAGVRRINELVDLLVTRGIPAVFVETSVADANVLALVEGAKSRGHDVRIGGSLFSDAMGAAGTYEGTYIGMIDHNATTIARALGGDAPARGMSGRLTSSAE
jgi:manganese/zinc/iron transport system substrate-binding protein